MTREDTPADAAKPRAEGADGKAVTQADLARKAMELKRRGQEASSMKEDGGALHPNDPDAGQGGKHLEQTDRNMPPSGAFEEAGSLPQRVRGQKRYSDQG